jgi:flagellar basal body rod protein FlgB
MLNDKQIEVMEYLALGELTKAEIAKKVGVSDRVIYKWQNLDEFKVELGKRAEQIRSSLEQEGKARMVAKGQIAIDNILRLATSATSEKVQLDASTFIYESIYGKATTKVADVTKQENNANNIDLDSELNEFVISIDDVKKAN